MTPGFRFATATLSMLAVMSTARAGDDKAPAAQNSPAAPVSKDPKAPHVLVTISKETTYITEPLRKDGYVDYVATLNERASKGVTPENNAAVLFWKAVGPGPIEPKFREEFFKRLGIPAPPDSGDYFIPFEKYVAAEKNAIHADGAGLKEREILKSTEFMDSGSRPWSKNEFPVLARWLAANEKPLAILSDASNRPRRFDPMIAKGDTCLIAVLLPAAQQYREVARALLRRAMLRISEDRIEAAEDDLLAVHRLARLTGQGATIIDGLVALTIEGMACGGDEAILRHGRISAASARKMQRDLALLPSLPKMVDKIDAGERFSFLDSVSLVARNGFDSLTQLTGGPARKNDAQKKLDMALAANIDWDIVLRMGNSWYDRGVAAFRKRTFADRALAFRKIESDIREMAAKAKDWRALIFQALGSPKEAVSQRIGEIFVALLVPAITAMGNVEDRAVMQFQLTELGFAMAAYHADHGEYPANLAELAPKYVREIAKDVFTDRELHYKLDGDAYTIYSVGVNGVDDGGKGYIDRTNIEDWDDLSIRVPDSSKEKLNP